MSQQNYIVLKIKKYFFFLKRIFIDVRLKIIKKILKTKNHILQMRIFIVIIISFTSRTIVIMLECGLCRFLAIFCIIELYMCLSVHNSLSCTYGFFFHF